MVTFLLGNILPWLQWNKSALKQAKELQLEYKLMLFLEKNDNNPLSSASTLQRRNTHFFLVVTVFDSILKYVKFSTCENQLLIYLFDKYSLSISYEMICWEAEK